MPPFQTGGSSVMVLLQLLTEKERDHFCIRLESTPNRLSVGGGVLG